MEVQNPHIELGICASKSTSPIGFLHLEQTITLVSYIFNLPVPPKCYMVKDFDMLFQLL